MSGQPAPGRPALRKAEDGSVHPITPRDIPAPSDAIEDPTPADVPVTFVEEEIEPTAPPVYEPQERGAWAPRGKRKGFGGSAGDSQLGESKDRLVDLGLRVPKSLRKKLRDEARKRGTTAESVLIDILRRELL